MDELELMSTIYSIIDICPKDTKVPHPFRDLLTDIMSPENPRIVEMLQKLKEIRIKSREQLIIVLADAFLMSLETHYSQQDETETDQ